jgi:alpha-mannosidase
MYGWPMNNYWTTNFNAEQNGGINWVYTLSSMAGNGADDAIRFGWGNRTPFLTRVLPGSGQGDEDWQNSFIQNWPGNLLLISALPSEDGKSSIFHVREIAGREADFNITSGLNGSKLKCMQVDATGLPVQNGNTTILPLETKFFQVEF